MSIYQLINSTVTNIKEYPVPDPNNLNPDEYQLYLEELPKQIESLRILKEIFSFQKSFKYIDNYLVTTGASPNSTKEMLSIVLEIVTVNREEDITDATLIFDGDLDLSDTTEPIDAIRILGNIQNITGDLYLSGLTSTKGLVLPSSIGGYLDLKSLTSAEGLVLPSSISGSLNMESLNSAEGLVSPTSVGGHLNLESLTSAVGFKLPSSVGGFLYLNGLTSAVGLVLPTSVGGYLYLRSLTSVVGLVLPSSISGGLYLSSLTSLNGLELPPGYVGPMYLPENLRSIAERDPRFTRVIFISF